MDICSFYPHSSESKLSAITLSVYKLLRSLAESSYNFSSSLQCRLLSIQIINDAHSVISFLNVFFLWKDHFNFKNRLSERHKDSEESARRCYRGYVEEFRFRETPSLARMLFIPYGFCRTHISI